MKKKATKGVIAVAALAIAFVGGRVVGSTISSSKEEITEGSVVIENAGDVTLENEETTELVDELFDSTFYGALYENDLLTYGPVCLSLSGYSLGENESEESIDYLISADGENLMWVNKNMEISASYELTDEAGILASYESNEKYTNVSLESFEKTMLGNYPEIIYTVKFENTEDGKTYYVSEVIVLDSMTATMSARLYIQSSSDEAYENAKEILMSLEQNKTPLQSDATENIGVARITIK